MLLVVFLVDAVGEFVCLDTKHGITQHTPMIHTPSMSTTAASRHDFIVDEIQVGENLSDFVFYSSFLWFIVGIEAFQIIWKQVNEATGAVFPVLDIFHLCIWPCYTIDTSPFALLRLIAGIECRECCTTASAFCTRVFVLAMYTSPSVIPCLFAGIEFRESFTTARAFRTRFF